MTDAQPPAIAADRSREIVRLKQPVDHSVRPVQT